MVAETLARLEAIVRPYLTRKLAPQQATKLYSKGRKSFLSTLTSETAEAYSPPEHLQRTLWGLTFRSPIMNAAGMFKNGEGYYLMHEQGAAGFLGGTTTWNPRVGNEKEGIQTPFVPYPESGAASNWLGLPNNGDKEVCINYIGIGKKDGFPLGHSVMRSPDLSVSEGMEKLVQAMIMYEQAGVDWLEINESCPNTGHGKGDDLKEERMLVDRLSYIEGCFLKRRKGNNSIPVVVKFSNDTPIQRVPFIMDVLPAFGFDGVNFGNTSTAYRDLRNSIVPEERRLYDYFTTTFGGGVSGRPLKGRSLLLAVAAVQYLREHPPEREFQVIRTGGIETWEDIVDSEKAGISMNQWFTGYFAQFAEHGHKVYQTLYPSSGEK